MECIGLSEGFVYKAGFLFIILMNRLEGIARDIVQGYVVAHRNSPHPLPVCLYNGAILNGQGEALQRLVREGILEKGISLGSLTLSREDIPLPDHYNVDVTWFIQHYAVV